ncbi:MAG: response regulator [Elusimicrobia bacterium]|nr:response regulator [Elusimicrobiota bacterium]
MPTSTYTTYEIARFCDVYPSTVIHWINDGKLNAYLTPGGHHRVTRPELRAFLKRFNIPIPGELGGPQKRVLIVDDEAEMAALIERAFRRHPGSFTTEVCSTGIDALIRIGQEPPDLVVLDIVLPKMDGCQVCKILKSKPETRGIKIVGISGKKLPFAEEKLKDYKVDAFYRKPLDLLELVAKASELLGVSLEPALGGESAR